MDDTFVGYGVTIDMTAKTIAVTGQNRPPSTITFDRPHPDRLILDGTLEGHAIHMETKRFEPDAFPLLSRGFNWIQERPFNR